MPNSKSTISEHLIAHFLSMKSSLHLDQHEEERFDEAIRKLEGKPSIPEENQPFWAVGEEFEIEDPDDDL